MIPISLELNAYLVFIRIAILFWLIYTPLIWIYYKYLGKRFTRTHSLWNEFFISLFSVLLAGYLEIFVYDLF